MFDTLIEKTQDGYTVYQNLHDDEFFNIYETKELTPELNTKYLMDESLMELLKMKDMVDSGCFKNVTGSVLRDVNGLTIELKFDRHEN